MHSLRHNTIHVLAIIIHESDWNADNSPGNIIIVVGVALAKMAEGIDTLQYKAVQSQYDVLAEALDANEKAKTGLTRKMVKYAWITHAGASNSSDQLVGIAMNRIKSDSSKFAEFVDMVDATEGLKHVAKKMRGMIYPVFYSLGVFCTAELRNVQGCTILYSLKVFRP